MNGLSYTYLPQTPNNYVKELFCNSLTASACGFFCLPSMLIINMLTKTANDMIEEFKNNEIEIGMDDYDELFFEEVIEEMLKDYYIPELKLLCDMYFF